MPKYFVQSVNKIFNVPDEKIQKFLTEYPNAVIQGEEPGKTDGPQEADATAGLANTASSSETTSLESLSPLDKLIEATKITKDVDAQSQVESNEEFNKYHYDKQVEQAVNADKAASNAAQEELNRLANLGDVNALIALNNQEFAVSESTGVKDFVPTYNSEARQVIDGSKNQIALQQYMQINDVNPKDVDVASIMDSQEFKEIANGIDDNSPEVQNLFESKYKDILNSKKQQDKIAEAVDEIDDNYWFTRNQDQLDLEQEAVDRFNVVDEKQAKYLKEFNFIQERFDEMESEIPQLESWFENSDVANRIKEIRSGQYNTQEELDAANLELSELMPSYQEKADRYTGLFKERKTLVDSYKDIQKKSGELQPEIEQLELYKDMLGKNYSEGTIAASIIMNATIDLVQGGEELLFRLDPNRILDGVELPTILKPIGFVAKALNPLGGLSKVMSKEKRRETQKNIDKWQAGISEQMAPPKNFEELNSLEDWGEWALYGLAEQAPQLALMYATGGLGRIAGLGAAAQKTLATSVLGASAAGGKFMEIQDAIDNGEDYNALQMYSTSILTGTAEALSERITFGQLKGLDKLLRNDAVRVGFTNRLAGNFSLKQTPAFLYKGAVNRLQEAGSEVVAQISNNFLDGNILGKNVNIYDGVTEAGMMGALISQSIGTPALASKLYAPFRSKDANQIIGENLSRLTQLDKLMSNPDISTKLKKKYETEYSDILKSNNKAMSTDFKRVDVMTDRDKGRVVAYQNEIYKKRKQAEAVNNDKSLTEEQRSEELSIIRLEVAKLDSGRQGVLNVYRAEEIDQKLGENIEFAEQRAQELGKDFFVGETLEDTEVRFEEMKATYNMPDLVFDPLSDGMAFGDGILINKTVARATGAISVGSHEVLHKVIGNSFSKLGKTERSKLSKSFMGTLSRSQRQAVEQRLVDNYNDGKPLDDKFYESEKAEEVFTAFSDAIVKKEIGFDEGVFRKIAYKVEDVLKNLSQDGRFGIGSFLYRKQFSNGRQAYNFMKSYQKSVEQGEFTKDVAKFAKEDSGPSSSMFLSKNFEAADKVNDMYEKGGVDSAFEIAGPDGPYRGMAEKIFNRYLANAQTEDIRQDLLNEKEDIIADILYDPGTETSKARTVLGLIQDYPAYVSRQEEAGEKVAPLSGFINNMLPQRVKESFAKRGAEDVATKSMTDEAVAKEAEGVADEVTQEAGRKTKLKVLADQLGVSMDVDADVAEANVDVTSIFNFKSVPNAVAGTVGKLIGISPIKIKSKANLTKAELANAQRFIKKNVGLLIGMMPEGFDSTGSATGVPKTMLDAFYTKRESRAKTKAGLQTQVKRSNIKDSEFLEVFNIFEGIPDRSDRNTSARVIALANLMGKVMTNQSIRKQNPGIISIADGMSKIMFSTTGKKSKESGDVDLNTIEGKQKQKDWLVKFGFATRPKSFWISNGQLLGSGAKYTKQLGQNLIDLADELDYYEDFDPITRVELNLGAAIEAIQDGDARAKKRLSTFKESVNDLLKKGKLPRGLKPLLVKASKIETVKKYELKDGERVAARKMLFANVDQLNNFIKEYEQNGGTFAPENASVKASVKRTTVYGKKTDKQVRDQINKNQELYNNSEKGFIDTWMAIQQDIKDNPNNKKHWAALLEVTSTSQANWMRVASRLIGSNTLGLKNVEEHMSPATDFAQYLWGMAKEGLLSPSVMKKSMKSFTQISLPEVYDKLLKGEGFDYTKNLPGKDFGFSKNLKFEILSGIMPSWVRYINPQVNAQVHYIDGVKYTGMNPNVLILGDGKNLAQTYGLGVDSSLEMNQDVISVQQELLFQVFTNNITKADAVKSLNAQLDGIKIRVDSKSVRDDKMLSSRSIINARPAVKYSKTKKGMSTFDFDETLIIDGENFVTATKDGEVVKIPSDKWPIDGPTYAEEGYSFDFSDFVNVRGGKEGPLLQKMKNQIKKYGTENVFVLTARMQEAAEPIHKWLDSKGIKIPLENITGLGKSEGDAKAQWFIDKYAEGYNDMYFVDDAMPNVEAVKFVFDQLDIKGKSVQAKIKFSKTLSPKFNEMLERSAGVGARKIFSKVEAAKRGKNKGKFTFFVPPSAEDFAGLLRYFAGTGKQGDSDIQFFNEALLRPFGRADREMSSLKQNIRDEYKNLKRKSPEVRKKLGKLIEGTTYTNDMAIRVYLFDKAGYEADGLSKKGKSQLINAVKGDPEMRAFADNLSLISRQKEGYLKPGENWNVENIEFDLQNVVNKVGRKAFLQEWVQNKDIIFSPENMNKIEAVYGTQFKEALKDVLFRMESGTNRSSGKAYGQGWTNWVNSSVGAIMFFNARSAVLQTLSTVNFINFEENNVFAAGKAFANQKQYWKDFSFLFNSDFLKNRRAGLATNVNEAELASAVAGATNKAKAALGYLLKVGFTPTQVADSFAIASGGATYYRNKIKSYVKSGMSQAEAEAAAMLDFQEIAEETQQSARPDRISQQQASPLGRLILAFANTPMQYNRIIKKAANDLVNKRGNWKSNVSRILYYGVLQNFIFATLQNALFALAFDDDEEKTEAQQAAADRVLETKKSRILNSMFDSLARGSGVYGAALATLKNALFEFYEQDAKGYRADYDKVVVELLNVSPPLGSKIRKLVSAGRTRKKSRKLMDKMSMLDYDNPVWEATGNVVEATTNIPMARVIRKIDNLREAFNSNNTTMNRIMLALGWSSWDLGVGTEVVRNEGKKNEYVVTLDTKRMNQEKVKEEIKEEKKQEKKKSEFRCTAYSKSSGFRCKNKTTNKNKRCYAHQ